MFSPSKVLDLRSNGLYFKLKFLFFFFLKTLKFESLNLVRPNTYTNKKEYRAKITENTNLTWLDQCGLRPRQRVNYVLLLTKKYESTVQWNQK